MKAQEFKIFSTVEQETWRQLYDRLDHCRKDQAHPLFAEGIRKLGITNQIPDLKSINARLQELTGFRGVAVEGLEDNLSFFEGLARREFPIGNFIRDAGDLNYTPAPDIFHDLYGHLPFLADKDYADFCWRFGMAACKFAGRPEVIEEFGRLFWFGVEFPLIETPAGRRIFGGGILSSFGESNFCLSSEPEVLPFDAEFIRRHTYRIDQMQTRLFVLNEPAQLYNCLDAFVAGVSH